MGHYKSNLRDLEFMLFEVLSRGEILGHGPYSDVDEETARDILREVVRLAENELADSLIDSDRNPPIFDPETHSVTIPESFKASYKAYTESGFALLSLPAELGGTVVPPSLTWAASELVLGANPAVYMYSAGFGFAKIVYELGNDEQKKLAQHMVDRQWGSTMVLTEPDAGSDVGAGRTKATQQPDGSWHITGVKRFITSAVNDMTENIIHLVLARPEGAGPGTKGLSLFVVPNSHYDPETGELGERNGVYVTNVEHKMGLKVSTTCEVRFGEQHPAVGYLLGDIHDGIAQMFRVIEHARMMVGTKAIATLSTGYLNALEFAKERLQGADLTQQANKSAPRVPIINHPDVRRSLMLQKSYAEGMRALVLFTASLQDQVDQYRRANDNKEPEKGTDTELTARVIDLLLPVVKGHGSERAWVLLGSESLQTYGGSGFLQDYPVEQYVRDAKIDTLYEGTTAIQGLDFFFRKIIRDRGEALNWVAARVTETIQGGGDNDQLAKERFLLGKAGQDVQEILQIMVHEAMQSDPRMDENNDIRNIYKVGLNTSRLLLAAGDVVVGWLLVKQAEVALVNRERKGVSDADKAFYDGKIAAARFYTRTVLPRIRGELLAAKQTTNDIMDVPVEAF